MPKFRARPIEFEAIQYTGQSLDDLPEWLTSFKAATTMGQAAVGRGPMGELLVPVHNGGVAKANAGDYVFAYEARGGRQAIVVAKAEDFERDYEPVPETDAQPAE